MTAWEDSSTSRSNSAPRHSKPRQGWQNIAHGVGRGFASTPLSPSPPPPRRQGRGCEGEGGPVIPGLTPWATLCRPSGPGRTTSALVALSAAPRRMAQGAAKDPCHCAQGKLREESPHYVRRVATTNRRFDSSWARRRGKPKTHDERKHSSWLPAELKGLRQSATLRYAAACKLLPSCRRAGGRENRRDA